MARTTWVMALALAGAVTSSCLGQSSAEDVQRRAIDAYREGRIDEAFTLANQAIKMSPDDPTGYFVRATVFETRQQYDQALADLNVVVERSSDLPLGYSRRGGVHFKLGNFDASIADFNREIELDPTREQNHWQRGLSYYYGGHYEEGWKQFDLSYRTANPHDYENGIYHFLCVAKAKGIEQARREMLDITGDKRVPMKEIYNLYRGTVDADAVFRAAESGDPSARERNDRLFYANLYVGLFEEINGNIEAARRHITRAVDDYPISHYMWDVARISVESLPKPQNVTVHRKPKPLPEGAVTHDWKSFLGPSHNAISTETKLLRPFPESGPPLVWELKTGTGYASPAIAGDRLVYLHRVGDMERVECLHPETGAPYWQFEYPTDFSDRYGYNNGPRASPVIDETRVYTFGAQGQMHCFDLATGKVVWKRMLHDDFKVPQGFFGVASTPLIDGDLLIVNTGAAGAGPTVVALDKLSGKSAWTAGTAWGASYASPIPATVHGKRRVFVFAGGESRPPVGGLLALDPVTGKLDFSFPWRSRSYESVNASSPVIVGNQVLIAASYRTGAVLLNLLPGGGHEVAWKNPDFDLHFSTAVHRNGYLYGFPGRNEPDAALACVNLKTGKEMWRTELAWEETVEVNGQQRRIREGAYRGSLLWADGAFLALGEHGHLFWLDLTPKGHRVISRAKLFRARETWALPVLSRGLLYISQNTRSFPDGAPPRLLCYDLREKP